MQRTIGGGEVGYFPLITVVPDSTFKTELTALKSAKSALEDQIYACFTFSNDWEVTSPADEAIPDGRIVRIEPNVTYTWLITLLLFGFTDVAGTWRASNGYTYFEYTGTAPSLQDQLNINGSDYRYLEGGSAGCGACVAISEITGYGTILLG